MKRIGDKKGQIWVETVIYTLIGLAIIGLVMAVALPKINQKKDEIVIEQSIEALGTIDGKIYEVQRAAGNRRIINLEIRKGKLVFDLKANTISWIIDSNLQYSEEGVAVPLGRINVTTRVGNPWEVELKMGYDLDLRYEESDVGVKQFDSAPTPYGIIVEHKREGSDITIDFSEA